MDSREVDVRVDTANTGGIIAGLDANVTILTPAAAPRVTDNVVLDTVLNTVTDSDDSVIDVSRTS